jgi:4-diphosphocytidyl-2-C-methyl-D-erythritol kinase
MIIFPKCKINIGLQIIEKRSDGYHNLESLFCDVSSPCDILEIVESDKLSFSIYGESWIVLRKIISALRPINS